MRLLTFIILTVIGALLWAGLLAGLGYELGHHAVVVAKTVSHYGLWISIALVVVVVFFQFRSHRHLLRPAGQARAARPARAARQAPAASQSRAASQAGTPSPPA